MTGRAVTGALPGRREFLAWCAVPTAGFGLLGSGMFQADGDDEPAARQTKPAGLTDTAASPHVVARSVGLTDARWTRGFWADRLDTCRRRTLPHLWRVLGGTGYSQ